MHSLQPQQTSIRDSFQRITLDVVARRTLIKLK
jgi:hypothetical protein